MSLHNRLSSRSTLRRSSDREPVPSPVDAVWGGREERTPVGTAYCIKPPPVPAATSTARGGAHLLSRLQLVYGIGPVTEGRLHSEGYQDLGALCTHPRWGSAARKVVEAINSADLPALRLAGAREIDLLPYFDVHDLCLIDIETTGLARALPVFLIGVGWYREGSWRLTQFVARGFEEEHALLYLALRSFEQRTALISYNGRAFDEPYVRARMSYYGLKSPTFLLHLDLYQELRRLRGVLPDCRLPTVVKYMLGLERGDDIPGALVPELYYQYVQESRQELLVPVLEHNARDLSDLCMLLDLVRGVKCGRNRMQQVG